jgi:hypothetical protein
LPEIEKSTVVMFRCKNEGLRGSPFYYTFFAFFSKKCTVFEKTPFSTGADAVDHENADCCCHGSRGCD